ncbi:MAG: T9SS type A sorting domain-containing protein [Bacteroidia bacterium]|nr:T9SS type A sorting domain-containing protein [Bacteroidia bacterium]MDW8332647.1 T9SS type A sorting domain-containing protein [Bacteroidia bacterium]
MNKLYSTLLFVVAVNICVVRAQTVYVDAVNGNDAYAGYSPSPGPFNSGPKKTLAAAMALVAPGNVIEIAAGTYVLTSTLVVNKPGVTLRGNGGAPNPRPIITGTANALIQPTSPNIRIENLNLKVNQVSCLRGINAPSDNYDGLVVTDCLIESALQDPNTNVVFESYGIYLFGSWNTTATCTLVKNIIQPEVYGASALFGRGIRLWGSRAVVGGSPGNGNYILALYGVQSAENGGSILISHNEFNTGNVGVEINVPNAGTHVVTQNLFRSDVPNNHVAHIEIKNNTRPGAQILIEENDVRDVFRYGVYSTRARNVLVQKNTFTPDDNATQFVMIGVNTKQRTEAAASSQTPVVNEITVVSNQFGSALNYPDSGTVFMIHNHNSVCSFGMLKFGGLGDSANVLSGRYKVMRLDPRSGNTANTALFPEYDYLPPVSHTPAAPANVNIDLRRNVIYMAASPSGLTDPTTFNHAQMLEIEDRTDHVVDYSALGFVLYKPNEAAVTAQSFIAPYTTAPSLNRALPFVPDNGTLHVGTNQTFLETVVVDKSINWISSSYTSVRDLTLNGPNEAVILIGDIDVTNVLTLSSGKIVTGVYEVDVLGTVPNSLVGGSASSYVEGNLRRSITPNSGPYAYPVGTALKGFQKMEITTGAVAGITNIRVEALASIALLSPLIQTYCSADFNYSLDNGSWRVRAFNGGIPVSVANGLNVTIYPADYTPVTADAFAVLRDGTVTGVCDDVPDVLTASNVGLAIAGSVFAAAAALNCPNPPSLSLVQPEPVCASTGTITLEAVSNATSFTWSGPGIHAGNRNLQNPPIARTPSNAGTYVCIASSGPGCLASRSVEVVIHANPGMPLVPPLIQVCATSTVVEPGIGSGGNGLRWYTSANATAPFSTTLSLPVGTPVTYFVATVNTATGCESARAQVEINVAPKPMTVGVENVTSNGARARWRRAPLWVTTPLEPYGAFEVQYIRVAPTQGTWQTLPIIADTVVQFTGLATGSTYQFRIRYKCLSGFSVYSDTTVVTRFTTQFSCPAPNTPTTSAAGSGQRNVNWNAVSGALSYVCGYGLALQSPSSWPKVIAYTNSILLTGLDPTKQYRARVFTNCVNANNTNQGSGTSSWSGTSATFIPNARIAVEGMDGYYDMKVYPNPNKGRFVVSFDSDKEEPMTIRLSDATGKIVFEKTVWVLRGANEAEVQTSLPAGVYVLSCQNDRGRRNVKICVER